MHRDSTERQRREIKAHASTVAKRNIRRLHTEVRTWIFQTVAKRNISRLRAEVRTWIFQTVVKRATSNKPPETKREQGKQTENKKQTFQRKTNRHVHTVEHENTEVSDSSDEKVTPNILLLGGPHSYYVSPLLEAAHAYGD